MGDSFREWIDKKKREKHLVFFLSEVVFNFLGGILIFKSLQNLCQITYLVLTAFRTVCLHTFLNYLAC